MRKPKFVQAVLARHPYRGSESGEAGSLSELVAIEGVLKDIRWELQQQRKYLEGLSNQVVQRTLDEVSRFAADRQLSFVATMEQLAGGRSFARFGDGEIRTMLRPDYKLSFQPNSPDLQAALRRVLSDPPPELLLGFPYIYRDVHWKMVWPDVWPELSRLLPSDVSFGNSHVSRPIFFQFLRQDGVKLWRNVWDGLDTCVITGRGSRFELIDPLFDNVGAVTSVYSTPRDAFADLAPLMEELVKGPTHDLYLIALGPAGTVLAAMLASEGRRAVDVGHVSDSYLNVFNGEPWPESKKVTR